MTTPQQRLDYSRLSPQLFQKYLDFAGGFDMDEGLALLVDIRASQLNGWNRLNVAFRTTPGSKDQQLGLDRAGLN